MELSGVDQLVKQEENEDCFELMSSDEGEGGSPIEEETEEKHETGKLIVREALKDKCEVLRDAEVSVVMKDEQIRVVIIHKSSMRHFSGVWSKQQLEAQGFSERDELQDCLSIIRAGFTEDDQIQCEAMITPVKKRIPAAIQARFSNETSNSDSNIESFRYAKCGFDASNALEVVLAESVRRRKYYYSLILNDSSLAIDEHYDQSIQDLRNELSITQDKLKKTESKLVLAYSRMDKLERRMRSVESMKRCFCKFSGNNSRVNTEMQWKYDHMPGASKDLIRISNSFKSFVVCKSGLYRIIGAPVTRGTVTTSIRLKVNDVEVSTFGVKIQYYYDRSTRDIETPSMINWFGELKEHDQVEFVYNLSSPFNDRLLFERISDLE